MALSDPDSQTKPDEWHFYECRQNGAGTGLNEDMSMHINAEEVNTI